MEPRGGKVTETLGSESTFTKLARIAELARVTPKRVLTTLAHHVDFDWVYDAHQLTRKDGAVGVDGQTAADYERDLGTNLWSLLERFKSGTYRAPPVRRKHIPKGDGTKTRPIGIPTFEDKVLQRAVTMALTAVYEQDFLDCSYGFRPGRTAHQALEALWRGLMGMGGGWVLDVDIEAFFDSLDHGHLRSLLDRRVRDGVLRRMVDKWLAAGVLENGSVSYPDGGTPQGGVISPLLANVYLHEVVDEWFEAEVKPRLRGRAFLIRYADDMVMAFEREDDARRVLDVLGKRLAKYGLTLHPEKTRLVPFRMPRPTADATDGRPRPGSFDFLGFTHYWGKSRKGRPVVWRKTASTRLVRAVKRVAEWCMANRHRPVREQCAGLARKLQGHHAYYGITGNYSALARFRHHVRRAWRRALDTRSQRARMTWDRFKLLLRRHPLPLTRVVHSISSRAANP